MRVHALWHGGSGYGLSDPTMDVEVFDSIVAAKAAFRERAASTGHYRHPFYYVNREPVSVVLPAVDGTTTMDVYYGPIEPGQSAGDPWFRLSLGPQGGVIRENY